MSFSFRGGGAHTEARTRARGTRETRRSLTHAKSKNERLTLRKSSRAPSDARLYVTARSVRLSHLSIGLGAWRLEAGAAPHDEGQGEGEGGHDRGPRPVHDEGLTLSHLHDLHGRLGRGGGHHLGDGRGGHDAGDSLKRTRKRRGGARSADDFARRCIQKLNRGNTSRLSSVASCRALRRSARAKGFGDARMERNRAATTPRTISSTVAIVQDGDVCDTVPRSRPFGGRPPGAGRASRRRTPREPLVAEEKNTPRACARFRAGDARSTATLGSRSRSVRRHDPRASPRRSRPSRSRDARELPERVARHADCRALFRADTIAGVFASRRTFCWTRTASTGAAAFATMAVRRAVLPARAATRAGSAILQV